MFVNLSKNNFPIFLFFRNDLFYTQNYYKIDRNVTINDQIIEFYKIVLATRSKCVSENSKENGKKNR